MDSSRTIWSRKAIETMVGMGTESTASAIPAPTGQTVTEVGNNVPIPEIGNVPAPVPVPVPEPGAGTGTSTIPSVLPNVVTQGKSADELILTGANSNAQGETPTPPPPPPENWFSKLKTAFATPNVKTVTEVYTSGVTNVLRPGTSGEYTTPWKEYADHVIPFFGENYPLNQRGDKYSRLLARQFNVWYLAVPMTYIIVLNWWYFWNYTDFSFDFRSLIEKLPSFKWAFEPFLFSVEFINYYLIGIRVDANISPKARDLFRGLWSNRPITFTVFYICVAGLLNGGIPGFTTVSDFLASILLGEPSIFARMMPFLGVFYYFYITSHPIRFLEYWMYYGYGIVIAIILYLIMSVVVAGAFGPVLLGLYLYSISYLSLFYFTFPGLGAILTWPWIMLREFLRIYHDLSEAPVSNPETKNIFGKVGNFLFQEFQNLVILFLICLPILIINLKDVVENTQENPPFMLFMFALNFSAILMVSGGMEITLHRFYTIIMDILTSLATFSTELPMKGIEEAAL